jgi:predicted ATPase/DNA-binding winged helix-turn-helix (wHTH) protein
MKSVQSGPGISFGPYQLDVDNARLARDGSPVALTPKALAVLHYLAARPDRLVSKTELLSQVWPDVIVGDASIKVCIAEIRKALQDVAKTPTYIETVHRRGYRFIAPVRESRSDCDDGPSMARTMARSEGVAAAPIRSNPIVGREKELRHLFELFDQTCENRRQCLFVSGGPGGGKSALMEAFSRVLSHEASGGSPRVLVGHCFQQFGTSEPYMPVWEAVGPLTREPAHAPLGGLLSRLSAAYTSADPKAQDATPSTIAPAGQSQRLLRELADAIESLAEQTPLVLILEDIHWADYSTIDLISALARRRSAARLMVVATYRPAEVLVAEHPLRGVVYGLVTAGLASELCLERLDESAVGQFLAARFPASQFPAALSRRLHQRTDGHPLFLVELVNDLVEQGVIVENQGAWQIAGAPDGEGRQDPEGAAGWLAVLDTQLPQTVRAMIEGNLARFDPQERKVLEGAAVGGVEFSAADVAAAVDLDVVAAEQVCDELAHRQRFIEPRGHVEWPDGTVATHYRFAHELYHRVVYEQIPIARRVRLHHQLGVRLERAWGNRAGEEAAALAIHFETARDWTRAVKYFRQAAQSAGRQYAHREAAHYLGRALDALERLGPDERAEHELDVLKSLGVNLQVTRGFAAPQVEAIHARAYGLCHVPSRSRSGKAARTFPVLWGIWLFHKVRSDLRRAQQMCDELLDLAGGDASLRLQAHQAMCVTHLCLGDPRVAAEHMERAEAIYDPALHAANTQTFGQDPGVATLAFGAIALWLLNRADEAQAAGERSLQLARRLQQPSSLALALYFAAMLHQLRGDAVQTARYAQAAIDIATGEGFSFWRAGGLVLRGWARAAGAEVVQGADPDAGLDDIRHGLDAWLATGSRTYHSYFLGLHADALLRLDRPAEALAPLDEAIAAARSLPEGLYEAELFRLKGSSLLASGKGSAPREARIAFSEALRVAQNQGARFFELKAAAELAALRPRGDQACKAKRLLEV